MACHLAVLVHVPGGGARERGREVRKANNSSPAATVNLGLLVLSVVQRLVGTRVFNMINAVWKVTISRAYVDCAKPL